MFNSEHIWITYVQRNGFLDILYFSTCFLTSTIYQALLHTPLHNRFYGIALLPTEQITPDFPPDISVSFTTFYFFYHRLKMQCCDTNCEFSVSTIATQCCPEKWKKKKTVDLGWDRLNQIPPTVYD